MPVVSTAEFIDASTKHPELFLRSGQDKNESILIGGKVQVGKLSGLNTVSLISQMYFKDVKTGRDASFAEHLSGISLEFLQVSSTDHCKLSKINNGVAVVSLFLSYRLRTNDDAKMKHYTEMIALPPSVILHLIAFASV